MSEQNQEIKQIEVEGQVYDVPKEVFEKIRRDSVAGAKSSAQNKMINTIAKSIGVELPLGEAPSQIGDLINQKVESLLAEREKQAQQEALTEQQTLQQQFAAQMAEMQQENAKERAKMQEMSYKNSVKAEMISMGLLDDYKSMIPNMMQGFGVPRMSQTGNIEIFDPSDLNAYKLAENGDSIGSAKQYAEMFRAQFPAMFKDPKKMPGVGAGNGEKPGITPKEFKLEDYKSKGDANKAVASSLAAMLTNSNKNAIEM